MTEYEGFQGINEEDNKEEGKPIPHPQVWRRAQRRGRQEELRRQATPAQQQRARRQNFVPLRWWRQRAAHHEQVGGVVIQHEAWSQGRCTALPCQASHASRSIPCEHQPSSWAAMHAQNLQP